MSVDDWKRVVDILGLALLALTLVLGIGSWRIGSIISARDDIAKKQLEASVFEAKTGLVKQEERTALAERATEEVRRSNMTLAADVAVARTEQQRVEVELNKQRERAATAERVLLELKQSTSDRRLTQEQRETFIASLRKSGPPNRVAVRCFLAGHEPCLFAAELAEAIRTAGWDVQGPDNFIIPSIRTGVVISSNGARGASDAGALALLKSLKFGGLEVSHVISPELVEDRVVLVVFPKATL